MYLLIDGEVGIYIEESLTNCIAVLKENKVFGERALETDDKRYSLQHLYKLQRGHYNSPHEEFVFDSEQTGFPINYLPREDASEEPTAAFLAASGLFQVLVLH